MRNPISLLRYVALVEGASFIALLFVAMPLKHFAGMPAAVKVVGWAHGVLFVALCAVLLYTTVAARWPIARAALVFVAALLPFGPFIIDARVKRYAAEFPAPAGAP
jgi:integral membrane protein